MLEVPNKSFAAPPPLPVTPNPAVEMIAECAATGSLPTPQAGGTDKVAVASTVCGLAPFIPVLSQVIGLILGIWALLRIRRSRRAGRYVRGSGWAAAGISGNGLVLLGWLALFGTFAALKGTLDETTRKLHPLLKKPAVHRHCVP